jgi:hypothetical protein
MSNIKDLLADLKKENTAQQQAINTFIEQRVDARITNLTNDLTQMIMANTSSNTPTPRNQTVPKAKEKSDGQEKGQEAEVKKIQLDSTLRMIADDLLMGNNVYLYGRAGTGKTVYAKNVAKYLNFYYNNGVNNFPVGSVEYKQGSEEAFYILNCSQWTSPMQIVGGFSINGYTYGQLELAWKYGGVLILDELPKLDPNTAGLLNEALSMANEDNPVLTSGSGERIPKHKDFMVVGAGNTNMKTTSANFGGNNRQDYSLVDRFVGSIYKVDVDSAKEMKLTYRYIYSIAVGLRATKQLMDESSVEAITLRSMLNFNRSYEQEWLRKMRSPMAFAPIGTTEEQKKRGIPQARTLSEAIMSFVNDLGGDRTKGVEADANFVSIENASSSLKLKPFLEEAVADRNKDTFVEDYKRLRKIDPKTGLYLETGEKAY